MDAITKDCKPLLEDLYVQSDTQEKNVCILKGHNHINFAITIYCKSPLPEDLDVQLETQEKNVYKRHNQINYE